MQLSAKKDTKQIVAYLLVGAGTALFELLVFTILFHRLGLSVAISNVTAVVLATALNFILNGTVTFKGSSNLLRSVFLYCLLFAFNTIFSTLTIGFLVSLGVPGVVSKFFTMICIVIWNFFLYKRVVFK